MPNRGNKAESCTEQVQEEDYGLSTSDIFALSDKDLNQLVGLKRYAPYKEGAMSKRAKRDTQHRLGQLRQVMSVDYIHSQEKLAAIHTEGGYRSGFTKVAII